MTASFSPVTRRAFLRGAAGASAATLLGGGALFAKAAAPGRPSLLWITAEDMSPTLGCYGDKYATTPHIDNLAKQSVRYTHAFASAPVCSPVRSCLITGCYATALGTVNLRSEFPLPAEIAGFPTYLRQAGYYCTNNVKTDYNTSNEPAIIKASWNECSAKAHWRGRKADQPFFAIFNNMVSHQSRTMAWTYDEFQKKVQSKLPEADRHDPEQAPIPPYYPDTPIIRRTVARYYDCVSVLDQDTGQILKQLEDDGLAEDTIVFFYSDHGSGLPRHKRLVLDSGMHVPLLIRFPQKFQHLAPAAPGATVDRLVSFVDFAPTVLSLLGQPVPKHMHGQPFLGAAATPPRTHVYGHRDRVDEAFDLTRCVRDKNWLYVRNYLPHLSYNQPSWYSDQGEIRDEITALAKAGKLTSAAQKHYAGPTRAREELYDTANDPHQIRNLAAAPEHEARLKAMRKLLRDWLVETRDLGFLPEGEMAQRMGDGAPFAMARREGAYQLERVLAAAELVGDATAPTQMQLDLLKDQDPAVRYWAIVGLRAHDIILRGQGKKWKPFTADITAALADASPAVRIEAAWMLVDLGPADKALALLAKELEGPDKRAGLRAARALQMLGLKALGAFTAMERALNANTNVPGDAAMFIRFSLDPAVKTLKEFLRKGISS